MSPSSPREWIHGGDYRPFVGVMVFIVAITAASMLFAKCCVGDRAFMRTGYDFEGYVMRKFAVCVGLPKRTQHPHVKETRPLEVEVVVVQEVPPPTAAPAPAAAAPPPPAAAPAPPTAAAIATTIAAAAAAAKKEEEDEEDEDWMEEDDDEEFNFEEEDDVLDL